VPTRPIGLVMLLRRPVLVLAAALAVAAPPPASAARAAQSWAHSEIRTVVSRGLMAVDVQSFRPDDVLLRGELEGLVLGLVPATRAVNRRADEQITMEVLNARLVNALDLGPASRSFAQSLRAAGIRPTPRFGTEVSARMLGLRKNHPAAQDALERLPRDPATRAEAAYSAARILALRPWDVDAVKTGAETFSLGQLTPWQTRVLTTAFSLVGYPYVWGGESEHARNPFRTQAQGGFDCSGFVWRVYKRQVYPGGGRLPEVLRGRTTFAMSGEVPARDRIPFAGLQPGDLIFFGKGPRSKPAEIDHMGIYVAPGWFVHSSRDGVTLAPLASWWRERFAWARRPLAEAGLEAATPPAAPPATP
jgi:cell wall-associated NlpC family hydrolase